MCCTVFLSMWLSNTSTTAMVMPIAEAVLQQLICTGLADSHDDSETADATEDESGTSVPPRGRVDGGGVCFSLRSRFVTSVVLPRSRFRQGGEPGEETAGAALPQREVRVRSSGAKGHAPPLSPIPLCIPSTLRMQKKSRLLHLARLVSTSTHLSARLTCVLALRAVELAAAEDSPATAELFCFR